MTVTVLAGVEIIPYTFDTGTGLIPYSASGTPLADGTILVAAQTPGGVAVRHYSRDLAQLLSETVMPTADTTGIALWVGSDGIPVLATSTQSWTIDPGTLTPSLTGSHPSVQWVWASGRATLNDATILLGNFTIVVHRPGQPLAVYRTDEDVSSVWVDNGTAYVSLNPWADGDPDRYLEARPFDPATGTIGATVDTISTPGQIYSGAAYVPAAAVVTFEDRPGVADGKLRLRTAAGIVADPDQPSGGDNYLHASLSAAQHPGGGTLVAAFHGRDGDTAGTGVTLAHATPETLEVTTLPLSTIEHVQGTTTDAAVTLAVHGGTALVLVVGYQRPGDFGTEGRFGLTAWTIALGGRHAQLRVAVPDGDGHPWSSRLVGDESWEHGPGRLKVPDPDSPSGWSMEVKPGDDTTNATWVRLAAGDGYVAAFRVIPWPGRS